MKPKRNRGVVRAGPNFFNGKDELLWKPVGASGDGRGRSATDPLPRKEPSLVKMIKLNHLKSLEIVIREYSTRRNIYL